MRVYENVIENDKKVQKVLVTVVEKKLQYNKDIFLTICILKNNGDIFLKKMVDKIILICVKIVMIIW